jgi:hypothetical protein
VITLEQNEISKEKDMYELMCKMLEQQQLLVGNIKNKDEKVNKIYETCIDTVSKSNVEIAEVARNSNRNSGRVAIIVSIAICLLSLGLWAIYFITPFESASTSTSISTSNYEPYTTSNSSSDNTLNDKVGE